MHSSDSPSQLGEYELIEEIARGGMGVVYKARQIQLNRLVALKMILAGSFASRDAVERFRQETEAVAALDHPNIIPIYQTGEHEGRRFFTMRLAENGSLSQNLRRFVRNKKASVEFILKVSRAVHHAHQHGILHRDLKPGNILLDSDWQPQVTDFGLARWIEDIEGITTANAFLGTPSYMAPEQANAALGSATTAADVYSLGAILYHLLTGSPPFEGRTFFETMRKATEEEPVNPGRLNPSLDQDLQTICLKCLDKNPRQRYSSAAALADDLDLWLKGEPISARPGTQMERARKWARRHPAFVTVVALVLFAGAVFLTQRVRNERALKQQRDYAVAQQRRAEEALNRLELTHADDLLAAAKFSPALAVFAKVLRRNPEHSVVASLIISLLSHENLALPLAIKFDHPASLRSARFSPDGSRIVTAGGDSIARLWNARTGEVVPPELKHESVLVSAEFSPDGHHLLVACSSHLVAFWELARPERPARVFEHPANVLSASFDRAGRRIVTTAEDRQIRIWDVESGGMLLAFEGSKARGVNAAVFSPDGHFIASASNESIAEIWESSTGKKVATLPQTNAGECYFAAFNPTGEHVLKTDWAGSAGIWDWRAEKALIPNLDHDSLVVAGDFSPDGRKVATASRDRSIKIWSALDGTLIFQPIVSSSEIRFAQFSPDGQQVLGVPRDPPVRLFDVRHGAAISSSLWHGNGISFAEFSRDGTRIVTASKDGTARIWNASDGQPLSPPLVHNAPVKTAHFSPDGRLVVTIEMIDPFKDALYLWDAATGRQIQPPVKPGVTLYFPEFSPDSSKLFMVSNRRVDQVWDREGRRLAGFDAESHRRPRRLRISPDGKRIAFGLYLGEQHDINEGAVEVWDSELKQRILNLPTRRAVDWTAFSNDSKRILATSHDRTVRVWEIETGKALFEPLLHEDVVHSALFSPDDTKIATACRNKTARLWDAKTGRALCEPMRHDADVWTAQFSPNGRLLLTITGTGTARIWDVETGLPLTEPLKGERPDNMPITVATSARFSPDSRRVVIPWKGNCARVIELFETRAPVPSWLPDLAEVLAGQSLDDQNIPHYLDPAQFLDLRAKLMSALLSKPNLNDYERWLVWFLGDRASRSINPFSSISLEGYVSKQLETENFNSLSELMLIAPTNALVVARFARQLQLRAASPKDFTAANFLTERAKLLAPPNQIHLKSMRTHISTTQPK